MPEDDVKKAPGKTSKKKTATKTAKKKTTKPSAAKGAPGTHRIFAMPFATVYPLYVKKVERKGRTKAEVDEIIGWLTGYRGKKLQRAIDTGVDFRTFFAGASMHPDARKITGLVCGIRVEDIEDPLMQKIRWLDKLIDELARGKKMESILTRGG